MSKLGKTVLFKPMAAIVDGLVDSNANKLCPAIVVYDWGDDCLNLKVIIDGNNPDIWATSVGKGMGEYQWQDIK